MAKAKAGMAKMERRAPRQPQVVVAGAGLAGIAFALAVAQTLRGRVAVTVCDPALATDPGHDLRASAIAAGGRRMLMRLGVWDAVAAHAQPMREMIVTDSRLGDVVDPVFLTFDGAVEPGEPFAHMVENGPLLAALRARALDAGVTMLPAGIARAQASGGLAQAVLTDGRDLAADLVVAADGARSRLRAQAGIGWIGWDYPQSGLVATVAHERDHEGRAVERFLPSGPFAILPLAPVTDAAGKLHHRSSIVWTERKDQVADLLSLEADDLVAELERRFGLELGEISLATPLRAWPLSFGVARSFVGERLALLGDAAHVIHPIAGQGLNLGLKDAAALAEAVSDAVQLGLDPGAADTLAGYERARRFDTVAMGAMTDGLNRLFSNDILPVRLLRDLGLGLVDRLPGVKRRLIREAAGLAGSVPALMR